jgi:hypothetical protein
MTSIFKFELRRNIGKVVIIILFSIIFGLLINQTSINKYKNIAGDEFIKIETNKVYNFYGMNQYITAGFKTMFVPAPISSFFYYSTILNDLHATVDTSYSLDLKSDGRREIGNLDFSWFISLVSSIFSFLFGFFAFRNSELNRKYLKLLLTYTSPKGIYINLVICRILLVFISLLIIFFSVYLQFIFNGFETTGLLSFFLVSNLIAIFFLGLGFIAGALKSLQQGAIIAALIWFIIFVLWPNLLNLQLSERRKMKFVYENEAKKVEIIAKGEMEVIENLRKGKDRVETIKDYINNFIKDGTIERLEIDMLKNAEKKARSFQFWSIFNPITFYQSVNNELSSRGHNEYCEFYKFNIKKKEGFIKFYLDRIQSGEVKPYLSGNEYIYYSKPSLPAFFPAGVLIQILYIMAFLTIGYYLFRKTVFPLEKNEVFSNIDLKLKKGTHHVYSYKPYDPNVPEQIYNIFVGNTGKFSGKISIDGKNIVTREKKNVVYLPVPDTLPGKLKVKAVINLFAGLFNISNPENKNVKEEFKKLLDKGFGEIEDIEKVNLMLRMAEYGKADIYLLNNFLIHIKEEKTLLDITDRIKKGDTLIVELNSIDVGHEDPERFSSIILTKESKYKELIIRGE